MNSTLAILAVLDGISYAALVFLVSVGLSLIFGVLRVVNVAHGSLYAFGAYLAATFSLAIAPISPWLTYPALLAASIVIGVGVRRFHRALPAAAALRTRRRAAAPDHVRGVHDHGQSAASDLGRAADLRRRALEAVAEHQRIRRQLYVLPGPPAAGRGGRDAVRAALLPAANPCRSRDYGGHGGPRSRQPPSASTPSGSTSLRSSSARASPRSAARWLRRPHRWCPAWAPT